MVLLLVRQSIERFTLACSGLKCGSVRKELLGHVCVHSILCGRFLEQQDNGIEDHLQCDAWIPLFGKNRQAHLSGPFLNLGMVYRGIKLDSGRLQWVICREFK